MAIAKSNQPQIGAYAKLSTDDEDRLPKIDFKMNETVEVRFIEDEPREFVGESGAYYCFQVNTPDGDKVILTSAWTLLKGIKKLQPIKGKTAFITKKSEKGKQFFQVVEKPVPLS